MSDETLLDAFSPDPVIGDGVITLPSERIEKMAALDLPEGVGTYLLTETTGNIQATNNNGRNIANIAMGSLQAGVARVHNEIGTEESRAISGVMATPVAAPTAG